jgi:hypothetical protein
MMRPTAAGRMLVETASLLLQVNADRKSGWAGETGAPTSLSGALE